MASAINTYILDGYVFMTGGTLTIEAGTVIKGENGSALDDHARTRRSTRSGTSTSRSSSPRRRRRRPRATGAALVLLGKATINVTGGTNPIEGFPTSFGDRIVYGGVRRRNAHDCGTLKYARIEYAGFCSPPTTSSTA